MSNNTNPFSLFLILVLLILSTDKHADTKLGFFKGLIDQTSQSLGAIRDGITAMNSSFELANSLFMNTNNQSGDANNS